MLTETRLTTEERKISDNPQHQSRWTDNTFSPSVANQWAHQPVIMLQGQNSSFDKIPLELALLACDRFEQSLFGKTGQNMPANSCAQHCWK